MFSEKQELTMNVWVSSAMYKLSIRNVGGQKCVTDVF